MCKKINLMLIMFLAVGILFVSNNVQAAEVAISLEETTPKVGSKLEVSGIEGDEYTYTWTVGEEQQEEKNNYYIPVEADYEKWIQVDVYDADNTLIGSDKLYFSKLPVVYIDTEDGKAITDKVNYKDANMYIQGNTNYDSQYDGAIEIKGRGNSSWTMPKKPYKIKLDSKTNLFGMGKNKHYVLLANYLDESLLRNTTGFRLSDELGLVNVQTIWVDVVLNGKYVGNYQLCEHIRADETRVPIKDWEGEAEDAAKAISEAEEFDDEDSDALEEQMVEDLSWITSGKVEYAGVTYQIADYYEFDNNINGGYLFELSEEFDEVSKFKTTSGWKVMFKVPEFANTNADMMEYAQNYWNQFDQIIQSVDGTDETGMHYTQMADFDSMIGYWLTMEIMGNNDATYKSRYVYKDQDGLLTFGPAWDFDWGCGSSAVGTNATGWKVTKGDVDANFYAEFVDDPYFTLKAQEKYWEIRDYLEDLIKEDGQLDKDIAYLSESGIANEAIWNYKRGFSGEEGDAAMFKKYLTERIAWLDEQFATQDSITTSVYTEYSAHPYVRSADKLELVLQNASTDTISAHAVADGVIAKNNNLQMQINVKDENTAKVGVYVNGLLYNTYAVTDGSCNLEIDAKAFTEEVGSKNVVSVIGWNKEDELTYTNYASIMQQTDLASVTAIPWVVENGEFAYDVEQPHILINQAYGGKKEIYASHSFIELYNPTDKDVDLNGWSLQYRSSLDDDSNASSWKMHTLSGVIPAKSSYLVRCNRADAPEKGALEIAEYDETWNQVINNKGFSVVLMATQEKIDPDAVVFDQESRKPLVAGYVDMFAVSGNDGEESQFAPAAEGTASAVQSKKKTVRRVDFADTDHNSVDGDMELVDYSFKSVAYLEWIAPRTSADGKWTATEKPSYNVQYQTNGGSAMEANSFTYYTKMKEPVVPERAGYDFAGWYADEELTEVFDFESMPTEDVTLYAKWKKVTGSISFNSNGGTEVETITDTCGKEVSAPANPEKSGYTFDGWYLDSELTNKYEFTTIPEADIQLYAKWVEIVDKNTGNEADTNTGNEADTNTGNEADTNTGNEADTNTGNEADTNTGNDTDTNVGNSTGGNSGVNFDAGKQLAGSVPPVVSGTTDNVLSVVIKDISTTTDTAKNVPDTTVGTTPEQNVSKEEADNNSIMLDANLSVSLKKNALKIKWKKLDNAEGYDVYAALQGKKYAGIAETVEGATKTSITLKKVLGKKISSKNIYKVKVRAWRMVNGEKQYIADGQDLYVAGDSNSRYTNVKKIKVKKAGYTLKPGATAVVKATAVKEDKSKGLLSKKYGPKLRYLSTDEKVATVSANGKVTAKAKGDCYIYVKALNGISKKIRVVVK